MPPTVLGGKVSADGVEAYAQDGRVLWRVALCQQSKDDAGEDISAPCRGHTVIAPGAEVLLGLGAGNVDGGVMSFCHKDDIIGAYPSILQAAQFQGMWCDDGVRGEQVKPLGMLCQEVQGIGIQDQWAR